MKQPTPTSFKITGFVHIDAYAVQKFRNLFSI